MGKGCRKLRISYDELAYILSLYDVDTYVFFENQGRNIDIEQVIPLINDMIRKKWLLPGSTRYMMSRELKQCVDHIKNRTCLFTVKSKFSYCHDLLCYSLRDSVLSLEKDYNREEYVLLSLNDAESFVEMLEEEGYLRNIIPVNEEDRNDAEKSLADYESIPDSPGAHASEDVRNAMLSFECIPEHEKKENDSRRRIPEDPFAEEDNDTPRSYDQKNTGVHVYGKTLYPYIAVKKDEYTIRIPYNKKNLERILSGQIMGGL